MVVSSGNFHMGFAHPGTLRALIIARKPHLSPFHFRVTGFTPRQEGMEFGDKCPLVDLVESLAKSSKQFSQSTRAELSVELSNKCKGRR